MSPFLPRSVDRPRSPRQPCACAARCPVGHQVRVRWYELPASCSTRRMVLVPSVGKLPRRKVRCKVLSDHVAVPSARRLGDRWAVATICARALAAYIGRRPRPRAMRTAASPCWLKRATRSATVVPLCNPASRAAWINTPVRATASNAVARRTWSTRSLVLFAMRCKAARSARLSRRNASRCGVGICFLPVKYPGKTPAPAISGMTH